MSTAITLKQIIDRLTAITKLFDTNTREEIIIMIDNLKKDVGEASSNIVASLTIISNHFLLEDKSTEEMVTMISELQTALEKYIE